MSKKQPCHIFIFRRDLRLYDNLGLNKTLEYMKEKHKQGVLLPIFIFNPNQVHRDANQNAIEFMVKSLESLNKDLQGVLQFFEAIQDVTVLEKIARNFVIESIGFNGDITPFAKARDEKIIEWSNAHKIPIIQAEDYTLMPVNSILNNSGSMYSVFTAYYKKVLRNHHLIQSPASAHVVQYCYKKKLSGTVDSRQIRRYYESSNPSLKVHGGREEALKILGRIKSGQFKSYDTQRDLPFEDKTTHLSAYLKFGCLSVREVYHAVKQTHGIDHGIIRELVWREFYANIMYNRPDLYYGKSFKPQYDAIKWNVNEEWFKRWCQGQTGVPIVDASMRQMNTTGWMHNRCRMIVASFLVKDLLIDWRLGERYFANRLVDYDPASNNGGWQFVAGTGTDAQPYFRIFNPFLQSRKFDAEAQYILEFIPELQDVPPKDIHKWDEKHVLYQCVTMYPPPMVIHKEQAKKALALYHASVKNS
jgi:deoxyribodipyrimidine photo-lyase